MRAAALLVPLVVAAGALAPAAAADAAPRTTAASPVTGYDVSYPQGTTGLPSDGRLAVVGVNGGVGTTTNPGLGSQLDWATRTAQAGRTAPDVYLNTQDPSPAAAAWWPSGNVTNDRTGARSPYGSCSGSKQATRPCAWVYGYSIAEDDLGRGVPIGLPGRWWLDVETANSWNPTRTDLNRAVLEGMTARLEGAGLSVGVYASHSDFTSIVGPVPLSSPLHVLPSWLAGSTTETGAKALCTSAPLTAGRVLLAQWVPAPTGALDHDLVCRAFAKAPAPRVSRSRTVGHVAVASTGSWSPEPSLSYRWTRDGHVIARATKRSHRIVGADSGHELRVVVTATLPGYDRTVRTSRAVRVHR